MDEKAVVVSAVSKEFKYSSARDNTLKSLFTGLVRKKDKEEKTQHALKGVSFEIKRGEFFGIVGRNGSGKSTLLKMLAGIYQPTSGRINVVGKLVPFIELGVGFNPELTGRENVYMNGALLNFSEKEVDEFYKEVVEFAELEDFMDKKLKNYSSGMQVRLAFSMAIRAKADILLIDEVLAVGDADFQHKCFNYFRQLKKNKSTVVFVSHDMSAVREYCDRAILVEDGEVKAVGSPNTIADQYSKLFISQRGKENNQNNQVRQGSGKVVIENVRSIDDIHDKKTRLTIDFNIKAKHDTDDLVVGIKCKSSADVPLLGTNTNIEGIKLGSLKKGSVKHLKFNVPNIFNNGSYLVDIVVESADGEVYDWLIDAVSFEVKTEKKTGYIVEVPISVEISDDR